MFKIDFHQTIFGLFAHLQRLQNPAIRHWVNICSQHLPINPLTFFKKCVSVRKMVLPKKEQKRPALASVDVGYQAAPGVSLTTSHY